MYDCKDYITAAKLYGLYGLSKQGVTPLVKFNHRYLWFNTEMVGFSEHSW